MQRNTIKLLRLQKITRLCEMDFVFKQKIVKLKYMHNVFQFYYLSPFKVLPLLKVENNVQKFFFQYEIESIYLRGKSSSLTPQQLINFQSNMF